jgi:hypothetical protein
VNYLLGERPSSLPQRAFLSFFPLWSSFLCGEKSSSINQVNIGTIFLPQRAQRTQSEEGDGKVISHCGEKSSSINQVNIGMNLFLPQRMGDHRGEERGEKDISRCGEGASLSFYLEIMEVLSKNAKHVVCACSSMVEP